MLAIFKKEVVNPPQELNCPASSGSPKNKPKQSLEILKDFVSSDPSNAFSMCFQDVAMLSHIRSPTPNSNQHRSFCGMNDMHCIFLGSLHNLCSLNRQYGLSKCANEAMFVLEAYKTLRDRGPFPAHQVLQDLDGSFGFVVYDTKAEQVFAALGANGNVGMFWGIAADGTVVISDKLEVVKGGCGKSYAPFPAGCMFHTGQGLTSYEHPTNKLKAMPRIDSEGAMCGASFNVDVQSKASSGMPRVGSAANWALGGSQQA